MFQASAQQVPSVPPPPCRIPYPPEYILLVLPHVVIIFYFFVSNSSEWDPRGRGGGTTVVVVSSRRKYVSFNRAYGRPHKTGTFLLCYCTFRIRTRLIIFLLFLSSCDRAIEWLIVDCSIDIPRQITSQHATIHRFVQ